MNHSSSTVTFSKKLPAVCTGVAPLTGQTGLSSKITPLLLLACQRRCHHKFVKSTPAVTLRFSWCFQQQLCLKRLSVLSPKVRKAHWPPHCGVK